MRAKSVTLLQTESPGRFIFSFVVASPGKNGERTLYQGVLPVTDEPSKERFVAKFQKLLLTFAEPGTTISPGLPQRKPPKGMVAIKKKRVAGEESE